MHYFSVSWDYKAALHGVEFQVTYQLARAGKCNEADENDTADAPFNRRATSWSMGKTRILYFSKLQLYANSSYWITVQSRKHVDNKFIYGQRHNGTHSVTPEGKYHDIIRPK